MSAALLCLNLFLCKPHIYLNFKKPVAQILCPFNKWTPLRIFRSAQIFSFYTTLIFGLQKQEISRVVFLLSFCAHIHFEIWLEPFKLNPLPSMSVSLSLLSLLKINRLSSKLLVDNGCLFLFLQHSLGISVVLCLSALLKITGSSLKLKNLALMTALLRATQNIDRTPAMSVSLLKYVLSTALLDCEPKFWVLWLMCFLSPRPPLPMVNQLFLSGLFYNQNKSARRQPAMFVLFTGSFQQILLCERLETVEYVHLRSAEPDRNMKSSKPMYVSPLKYTQHDWFAN